MSGRDKIEGLTNAWYGFAVFSALAGWVIGGFGIFSLIWAVGVLAFSLFVTFVIGRRLIAGSSLTRRLMVLLSAVLGVLMAIGTVKLGWSFLGRWELSILAQAVLSGALTSMYVRSLRVLTNESVKAHCR